MRPVLEKAGPTRGGKEVLEQRCELETTEILRQKVIFACFLSMV